MVLGVQERVLRGRVRWSGDLAFALQVNCLFLTHYNDIVLATGSSDKYIATWDLRRACAPPVLPYRRCQ